MEYIRYYSTIILWASPFPLSGIKRNYDGEFPSKIARTLFHPNNISYVGRMIIRPSNESGRSRTIDIYVRCFPDSWPRRTHFHTTPANFWFLALLSQLGSVALSLLSAPQPGMAHVRDVPGTMQIHFRSCLRLIVIAVTGLGAPLSRSLEGALYKFLNEWMNE